MDLAVLHPASHIADAPSPGGNSPDRSVNDEVIHQLQQLGQLMQGGDDNQLIQLIHVIFAVEDTG
ncbi:hypothetical protein D3C71_2181630 [compost metagenome]